VSPHGLPLASTRLIVTEWFIANKVFTSEATMAKPNAAAPEISVLFGMSGSLHSYATTPSRSGSGGSFVQQ
jgi:hypothetical protein